jgi:4-hydroxy-3-polyprenylbenzoate decarboxylase
MPVAINVLGTLERVCWALAWSPAGTGGDRREAGSAVSAPAPEEISQAVEMGKALFDVVKAKPDRDLFPPCHQVVLKGDDVDLTRLPLLRVYGGDAGKVITLGLMVTKDPESKIPNVGVYRLQLQSKNTMTVQWLSVRGRVVTCARRRSGGKAGSGDRPRGGSPADSGRRHPVAH